MFLSTPRRVGSLFCCLLLLATACTDAPPGHSTNHSPCGANAIYNEVTGECVLTGENTSNQHDRTHPHEGRENLDPWGDESGDGVPNQYDNCPYVYNPDQLDTDGDGIGDACDNCPYVANPDQAISPDNPVDDRGIVMGDACAPGVMYYDIETDSSGDGVPDAFDNCPDHYNPDQLDTSGDGVGDVCDNCPNHYNPYQVASPGNPVDDRGIIMGDACAPVPNNIPICATLDAEFEVLNPNVYLVLDMSGSMGWYVHNTNNAPIGERRWDHAMEGLDMVVDSLYDQVRFGVGEFRGACGPDALTHLLTVGDHDAATIKSAYHNLDDPSGGTPLCPALEQVRDQNHLVEPDDSYDNLRAKGLVLVFDGDPTACTGCGNNVIVQILEDFYANGIETFVVGFAYNHSFLVDLAIAGSGGTRTQPYLATDGPELAAALESVAELLIDCSYVLNPPPADPNKIWVSVQGTFLAESDWTYTAAQSTLEFSQAACDNVRSISADQLNIEIQLGCADECIPEEPSGLFCDLYYETCGEPYPCDSCEPEICNGEDSNCNGIVDDGCPECGILDSPCQSDADCCTPFVCNDGTCGHDCYPVGVSCSSSAVCCSGICGGGICVVN
jgi:hypothetical protein